MSDESEIPETADQATAADQPAALQPDPVAEAPAAEEPATEEPATEVAPVLDPPPPPEGSDAPVSGPPPPSDAPEPVAATPPPPPTPAWAPPEASDGSDGSAMPAAVADRPEIAVSAAFAGGFVLALILKRLAR